MGSLKVEIILYDRPVDYWFSFRILSAVMMLTDAAKRITCPE